MKPTFYIALFISIFTFSSCTDTAKEIKNKITITGKIKNYDQDTMYMENYSVNKSLLKSVVHPIPLDENNSFEYTFDATEPAYFKIVRSYLYLSPGDSLNMQLDANTREDVSFSGNGAEANNYLRSLVYPKAGSYWMDPAADEITSREQATGVFDKIKESRIRKLDSLSNVSTAFKALEKDRITFDYVNSLLSVGYLFYPKLRTGELTQEQAMEAITDAQKSFNPEISTALNSVNYDKKHRQHEVYQSIMYYVQDSTFRAEHKLPALTPEFSEFLLVKGMKDDVSRYGYTAEYIQRLDKEKASISNPDYIEVLDGIKKEYKQIDKGATAPEIVFTNLEDQPVKLSSFKGKVIVIDLWATWCGPCMTEKPFFEKIEEKYSNSSDIVFISASIDKMKIWKSYFKKNTAQGHQLQVYRDGLKDYKIVGIPRFMVIDKDFKIVSVFAPMPSSGALEQMIKETL